MRDSKKYCRPKLTNHPKFGDIVIKMKCGHNGIMHANDYEKVQDFFKILSFIGEENKPGNIKVLNKKFDKETIFNSEIYNLLKDDYEIIEVINSKTENIDDENPVQDGDIICHNTILNEDYIFSYEDWLQLDDSWKFVDIYGVNTHSKSSAKVGDILILSKNLNVIVNPDDYNKASDWNAIGIIAIESRNTPDNKVRILSLDYMDYNNPEEGNSGTGILMLWGAKGDINGMNNFTQVPCMSKSDDKILTEDIQRSIDYAFLPTDYFSGTQSLTNGYKYWNLESSDTSKDKYCPPAYLENGNLNPLYTAIQATIPGTSTQFDINNALSDFDGLGNTQKIMELCTIDIPINSHDMGNYPAAQCCDLYNKGGLRWYLPACGELGLIISNFSLIDSSRTKLKYNSYNYTSYWYWSSTLHNSSSVRVVGGNYGYCSYNSRGGTNTSCRVLACAAF